MIREARRLSGVLKRSNSPKTERRIERISEELEEPLQMLTPQERECINGIEWFADGDRWIINEAFLYAVGEDIEVIVEEPYQSSYDATYKADYDQTEDTDTGTELTEEEVAKILKSRLAKFKAK